VAKCYRKKCPTLPLSQPLTLQALRQEKRKGAKARERGEDGALPVWDRTTEPVCIRADGSGVLDPNADPTARKQKKKKIGKEKEG